MEEYTKKRKKKEAVLRKKTKDYFLLSGRKMQKTKTEFPCFRKKNTKDRQNFVVTKPLRTCNNYQRTDSYHPLIC